MKANIVESPVEVTNRLAQLGWTREELIEVVDAMVAARNGCTENDPPGAPGWKVLWCDGTRRSRELALLKGWERNDDNHISSAFSRERGIKLAVSNTDDGTGLAFRTPQNRSKKGAATDFAVSSNQGIFADILERASNVIQLSPQGGVVYWYLCVYCEGDVVRAELSCPTECENGFFKEFAERIFLIGGDDDRGEGVRRRTEGPDSGEDFDINVLRKLG